MPVSESPRAQPFAQVLQATDRSFRWLARRVALVSDGRVAYSKPHVWRIAKGQATANNEFRAAVATVLDLPESELFHPEPARPSPV